MATTISLLDLPDELIHNIFIHLPASSAATFGQTSKRVYKISNTASLWRRHCKEIWSYWEGGDGQPDPDSDRSSETSWKQLFFKRAAYDQKISATFEDLLSTQQSRMARMQDIAETYQYDAKDVLLRQLDTPDDAEDVLARRYWSDAVLGLIHRQKALQIWDDMQYQDFSPLETSLCAFDLFVQGSHDANPTRLSREFDDIAKAIKDTHEDWENMDYISQAAAVARYLRAHKLVGASEDDFHLLRNNFMCLTLTSGGNKTSLPLQSVTIFCCIAQRLGVKAWPCSFPRKVFAVIQPPDGPSLRETRASKTLPPGVVWMDPFSSTDYISEQVMRSRLQAMGNGSHTLQYKFMTMAFTRSLVFRTGANIMASLTRARDHIDQSPSPEIDPEVAYYSSLWAMFMMSFASPRSESHLYQPEEVVMELLRRFQEHFTEDTSLIEKYVMPFFYHSPAQSQLAQVLEEIRISDSSAKPITPRDERTASVKYKVGQVFRHARYQYVGVIIGWDPCCQAGEDWIQTMRVSDLPRGREQSFYHILGADKSSRYVAEENIALMEDRPPEGLMKLAGRHFKRWDDDNHIFVSNMKDEYPDD